MRTVAQWLALILLIGSFLVEAGRLTLKLVDVYDAWRSRARRATTPSEAA